MATYILRDLPEDLWARVKARAEREGRPLRPLFLDLLDRYAMGGLESIRGEQPSRHPAQTTVVEPLLPPNDIAAEQDWRPQLPPTPPKR